jgi:hypothetical protein
LNHNTAANLNAASEVIGMSAFGAEPEIVLPDQNIPGNGFSLCENWLVWCDSRDMIRGGSDAALVRGQSTLFPECLEEGRTFATWLRRMKGGPLRSAGPGAHLASIEA